MNESNEDFDRFSEESIAHSYSIQERAEGRVPKSGLAGMAINSYIASISDLAGDPRHPEQKRSLDKQVGLMAYLRDTQGAQTIGDALGAIRARKIDPEVVRLWVEEEMAVNPGEFDAIKAGYPELADELQQIRDRVMDRYFKQR